MGWSEVAGQHLVLAPDGARTRHDGDLIDPSTFAALSERHRRELHVHCYRMLASFDEADDAVQETFLRAWNRRAAFEGEHPRAWLYRIATNVCLDQLRRTKRRPVEHDTEVLWLQPYPDPLLDEIAIDRETIELTFLAALQVLPPKQRATLIARDVLGWSAIETAALLDTSVAAANSALQRARATMQSHLPGRRSEWTAPEPSPEEADVLARFIEAHERCDAELAIAIAAEDIRVTMPPYPWRFDGLAGLQPLLVRGLGPDRAGDWRLLPVSANRQPAAANYLRRHGDDGYRPFKLDVLRVVDGKLAEIITFGPDRFDVYGLPDELR